MQSIITITGPSSSGKTVLSNYLQQQLEMECLISTTTRPKRHGEQEGKDYYFLTRAEFEEQCRQNNMVESVEYDNNYYGISVAEVQRAFAMNKPAVLVAEPNGVEQIRAFAQTRGWSTLHVFVYNPLPVLLERMLSRVVHDVKSAANSEKEKSIIQTHAKRMEKVLGFEQESWVKPALNGTHAYDLIFDRFDATNESSVIAAIQDALRAPALVSKKGRHP